MTCRRDRALFLLTAALLGLGSCGEKRPDPSPLERARQDLAQGDPFDAQIKLEKLVGEGAPKSDVAAYLGEAALAQGDLDEARRWLAGGDFSRASRAHGLRILGRLALAEGNLPEAGRAFDKAYAIAPDSADLWVDIGRLRYRGGEQIQAIKAANKALALDPHNASALQFRVQLARDAQGMVAGSAWFARALGEQPDNIDLRVEYAATLGDAGENEKALEILRGGNGQAAASPRGLFVQAVIAARAGYDLLARELLDRSGLERGDLPAAKLLSAIVDLQAGNYESATQTLDRLNERQPDNGRVVDLLAFALSRTGSDRELVQRFAARAAGPLGTPYLRTLVGRSLEALDDRAGAARFLDRAANERSRVAILPSAASSETDAGAGDNTGSNTRDFVRDALAAGRASAAVQHAKAFAQRFPGSGDAQAILGDAELAAGNRKAARDAYRRSAAIRQPWPLVLKLADSEANPAAAHALLENYVRNNPLNSEAAVVLADAYAAQGNWRRAALLLDHAMGLGQERVPWVLAARSVCAARLDDSQAALDYALDAHALQPMNPLAISALIAALPQGHEPARRELQGKLRSLTVR